MWISGCHVLMDIFQCHTVWTSDLSKEGDYWKGDVSNVGGVRHYSQINFDGENDWFLAFEPHYEILNVRDTFNFK